MRVIPQSRGILFAATNEGSLRRKKGEPGGGKGEKKASVVRGHIRETHEIIMVYIKCNLAKRMQCCIEAWL